MIQTLVKAAGADKADSSGDKDPSNRSRFTNTAAELVSAFGIICRRRGATEGMGFPHFGSLNKIESSVTNFMIENKQQAKLTEFFPMK